MFGKKKESAPISEAAEKLTVYIQNDAANKIKGMIAEAPGAFFEMRPNGFAVLHGMATTCSLKTFEAVILAMPPEFKEKFFTFQGGCFGSTITHCLANSGKDEHVAAVFRLSKHARTALNKKGETALQSVPHRSNLRRRAMQELSRPTT